MTSDLSAYKVSTSEVSAASKFDNLVQAIQDALNAIGDTSKMAWAAGQIIDPAQLKQGGASSSQVLAWNGSAWAPAASSVGVGVELDYKQITADVTGITATTEGTAVTVITANSITYDGTRAKVEAFVPGVQLAVGANALVTFVLLRDSVVLGQAWASCNGSAGTWLSNTAKVEVFDTPSAAAHTYALKAFTSTGTVTVKAGAGGAGALLPSFLRVTKA